MTDAFRYLPLAATAYIAFIAIIYDISDFTRLSLARLLLLAAAFQAIYVLLNMLLSVRIFISYRIKDTEVFSNFLYRDLSDMLRHENIFIDNSKLKQDDFLDNIFMYLRKSTLMLIVIGDSWLKILNERAVQFNKRDYVREEIVYGYTYIQHSRIIKILVDEAVFPMLSDLPIQMQCQVEKWSDKLSVRIHCDNRYAEGFRGLRTVINKYNLKRKVLLSVFTVISFVAIHLYAYHLSTRYVFSYDVNDLLEITSKLSYKRDIEKFISEYGEKRVWWKIKVNEVVPNRKAVYAIFEKNGKSIEIKVYFTILPQHYISGREYYVIGQIDEISKERVILNNSMDAGQPYNWLSAILLPRQ